MDIDVNGLGGQILQFGFLANTNDFEPSTVIYDNISFTPEPTSAMLLGLSGLVLLRRRRR
ncbi:MAG: PEP-CTERM sorting domain-containing protein [Akkermansiaceae bacterium]|nr:PEP-CTERM sorting domain-containing protein [Akkermansiaceae bacterium]